MDMKDWENKMKKKLEERRITPSESTWSQLDCQLDNEKQKNKKGYWWVGIAAAFLLGILISNVFEPTKSPADANALTNKPSVTQSKERSWDFTVPQIQTIASESKPIAKSVLTTKQDKASTRKIDSPDIVKNKSIPTEIETSKPIEGLVNEENMIQELEPETRTSKIEDLNTAIAGIVEKAKVNSQNHEVSDQEIDQLLLEAQFKVRAEAAFKESANTVNAEVLLQEVELELDKSLKERIFNAIHDGLDKAKMMLADRGRE